VNYQAWTLVAVWVAALISIGVYIRQGIVTSRQGGVREQRQTDQEEVTLQHRTWLLTHDTRLGNHDIELAENRGFREGLKVGKEAPKKAL